MASKDELAKASDAWMTVTVIKGLFWGACFVLFLLALVGRALYLAWH